MGFNSLNEVFLAYKKDNATTKVISLKENVLYIKTSHFDDRWKERIKILPELDKAIKIKDVVRDIESFFNANKQDLVGYITRLHKNHRIVDNFYRYNFTCKFKGVVYVIDLCIGFSVSYLAGDPNEALPPYDTLLSTGQIDPKSTIVLALDSVSVGAFRKGNPTHVMKPTGSKIPTKYHRLDEVSPIIKDIGTVDLRILKKGPGTIIKY